MIIGKTYDRKEIHEQLGGGHQGCFLTQKRRVTGLCLVREKNPEAPFKVLVGTGKIKESAASWLSSHKGAVPMFLKQASNAWEYLGEFDFKDHVTDKSKLAEHIGKSNRKDVTSVLIFATSHTSQTSLPRPLR
jgi:hypothetical protein